MIRGGDELEAAEHDESGGAVDRDRVAFGNDVPTEAGGPPLEVDHEVLDAGDARLAHAAGDDRGV